MKRIALSALTALAFVASAATATAGPNDLQVGGNGPDKVLRAQLGIQGPATTVCPTEAKVSGWVFTNYAGPVQVMIARKGQGVGAPFTIQAKKAANGQYMATFKRTVNIIGPIDAEYRLLVGGGDGVTSNWVPLKASCSIGVPQLPGFKAGG